MRHREATIVYPPAPQIALTVTEGVPIMTLLLGHLLEAISKLGLDRSLKGAACMPPPKGGGAKRFLELLLKRGRDFKGDICGGSSAPLLEGIAYYGSSASPREGGGGTAPERAA